MEARLNRGKNVSGYLIKLLWRDFTAKVNVFRILFIPDERVRHSASACVIDSKATGSIGIGNGYEKFWHG